MVHNESKRRLNYEKRSDSKDFRGGGSSLSSLTAIGTGMQPTWAAKISIVKEFLRQWKFEFILSGVFFAAVRGCW